MDPQPMNTSHYKENLYLMTQHMRFGSAKNMQSVRTRLQKRTKNNLNYGTVTEFRYEVE